jgi:hypothetical protein
VLRAEREGLSDVPRGEMRARLPKNTGRNTGGLAVLGFGYGDYVFIGLQGEF